MISRSGIKLLASHQLASMIATGVDFGTLAVLVEFGKLSPAPATLIGASLGAVVNFSLNRHYAFKAVDDEVGRQALRYAFVSGASAALNTLGEYLGATVIGLPYFATRIGVAAIVSLGWNFPMHRRFVFRTPGVS